MNANELALQGFYARLGKQSACGKTIPQTIRKDLGRLESFSAFQETELSRIASDKLIARIENNILALEEKSAPKSTTYVLGERQLSADLLLKRAILYAEKAEELIVMQATFEHRKAELIKTMSEAESRIPMVQSGEFSALVKQAREKIAHVNSTVSDVVPVE